MSVSKKCEVLVMKNVVNMSKEDKRFIFDTTAMNMKIHPSIIEKDFWICYILHDRRIQKTKQKDWILQNVY